VNAGRSHRDPRDRPVITWRHIDFKFSTQAWPTIGREVKRIFAGRRAVMGVNARAGSATDLRLALGLAVGPRAVRHDRNPQSDKIDRVVPGVVRKSRTTGRERLDASLR
jgi:hypothetical protein